MYSAKSEPHTQKVLIKLATTPLCDVQSHLHKSDVALDEGVKDSRYIASCPQTFEGGFE